MTHNSDLHDNESNISSGELTVNEPEPAYDLNRRYTVEEWEEMWREDFRCELHDGLIIVMDGATVKHENIFGEIFVQLHSFLRDKPCKVFASNLAVRLNENEHTVFLPDIKVICDKEKLSDGKRCNGAPDMVVEILSPSTSRIDREYKFDKYQKAGVKEYWIVDPELDIVQVNILNDGKYITYKYDKTATVKLTALKGCEITLADVFEE